MVSYPKIKTCLQDFSDPEHQTLSLCLVSLESLGLLVRLALTEKMGSLGLLVRLVRLVLTEKMGSLGRLARPVLTEKMERLGLLVDPERLA